MIPEAVTITTMALAMGTYGRIAGPSEAQDIRDRINAGIDEDLDHAPLLRERIAVGAIITLVLSLAYAWFLNLDGRVAVPTIIAHALRLAAFGWASFTIAHRLTINSARVFPWWYCAPGNNYDWRFITLFLGWTVKGKRRREMAKEAHADNWRRFPTYRTSIRNAGIAMFSVEGLVAGITAWSLWW